RETLDEVRRRVMAYSDTSRIMKQLEDILSETILIRQNTLSQERYIGALRHVVERNLRYLAVEDIDILRAAAISSGEEIWADGLRGQWSYMQEKSKSEDPAKDL